MAAQNLAIATPPKPTTPLLLPKTVKTTPKISSKKSSKPFSKPSLKTSIKQYTVDGIPLYQTTIDLTDPQTFITIGLANNATQANNSQVSYGAEPFPQLVSRLRATVVANGTFFSKDAQMRVMGNLVAAGQFLKYSPWENYGTTLGLGNSNRPGMVTARVDGKPSWDQHWLSITSGPRLLRQGKVWLAPASEGFRDPNVLGVASRSAIGYPKGGKKLVLVTFLLPLSLEEEAKLMRKIGCYEAMNLDGGSSLGLAHKGQILVQAGRTLTNVLVVYDAQNPAPKKLRESWIAFQRNSNTMTASQPANRNGSLMRFEKTR